MQTWVSCFFLLVMFAVVVFSADDDDVKHAHDCKWTAPDGSRFDLSQLTRHAGDGDFVAEDPKFLYYLNVCGDTELIPHQCKRLAKHNSAPAYQVFQQPDGKGPCYWLGDTKSYSWSLMDETQPQKGVELVYRNGEMCGNKRHREIRFHFICAHGYDKDESEPLFVVEHQNPTEVCHYNVTWPTMYGCPVFGSGLGRSAKDRGGAPSQSDLLFYPGLSVLLWTAGIGGIGYLVNMLFFAKSSAGPRQPRGRVIDNMLPDNDFNVPDSESTGLMS